MTTGKLLKGAFRNLAIDDTGDLEAKNMAEPQMRQIMQMSERSIAYRALLFHKDLLDRVEDLRAADHDKAESSSALLDLGDRIDDSQAVTIDLPAGGVTIYHCQTLHYTAPNTTDRQRRAFAIHYRVPGTKRLRTGEYIDAGFSNPMLRVRV